MLIILPNSRLSHLEGKLKDNFTDISSMLLSHEVSVKIPKFKIEVHVILNKPLNKVNLLRSESTLQQIFISIFCFYLQMGMEKIFR